MDDDYKPLDAKLMKTFRAFRRFDEEPYMPALLSVITLEDKRLVTLGYEEAEALLTRTPSINLVLQKAWKEGSFKEVRQLNVLWPVVQEKTKRRSEDVELTNKALRSAWHDNYLGNNHRLLFANLNAIPPTQELYSNQIAIVQSSGTGKSRMVHEQANLVFTIPFNLREKVENEDLTFPIPDDAVRKYLVKTSLSGDHHVLKTNYLKFLGNVFTQVYDELERCREELKKQTPTAADLAKWWSRHLEGRRTELYKAAIDSASNATQLLPAIQKRHKQLLEKRRSKTEEDFEDADVVVEFAAAEAAKSALNQLISKLDSWAGTQRIKLIIYFDEAHPLTKVAPKNDDEKTPYDWLCSCLNQFVASPMFCIFLSTNPSLAHFASPKALASSARICGGKAATHAPITETPFDCCEDLMVGQGQFNMKDISTIPFMAQFGRPLFWALLRGAGMKAPELHAEILELARTKLVAAREIDAGYDTLSRAARLAVLDVQLSLDFETRREKVQLEEAGLVESHMRIAYSIPGHREYLHSGYPSEPLLAEAAAQQLWRWRTQNPFMVVETLTSILETGLLDPEELWELTGRQLLLDAYHRAVELEQCDRPMNTPPNFSAGCHLITFIEMLYTQEYAEKVLDSTPDNVNGQSFKEVFKDALICFTHFGKMTDDTGVTSTVAWAAFIRHMAIMCRNNQRILDCVIPVVLWDTQLCEHVMTGVLVQFTRRKKSGTIAKYSIDQDEFNFFPKTSEKCTHAPRSDRDPSWRDLTSYRPYVSLIMELGVQPKAPEQAKTATVYRPGPSSSKKPDGRPRTPPLPIKGGPGQATPSKLHIPQHGKRHYQEEGHARYNVFACGCSPTVYRGIDATHKACYARLLSSRDFLGEHARKDAESLKAVRRMKPFWNGGNDCYHWVEHNDILHGPAPPPEAEFFVGNQAQ